MSWLQKQKVIKNIYDNNHTRFEIFVILNIRNVINK